ncbi:MAG TPA: glycosyltransferase [Rhodanobacteraceae bacterium]|nr:glycosyltransferase [Rhodanobacteraceae bacterium]
MTSALAPLADVSVVIPLAPGERQWRGLLADLANLPAGAQVILIRAESTELDLPVPPQWPRDVQLIQRESMAGRARQMNLGARDARNPWLWFLHADSRVTGAGLLALAAFVARAEAALGFFDLRFRDDGPALARLNAWGARWRSRRLRLPFGDQGLVMPAATFAELGAYDERAAYGEDHLLVWAAHARRVPIRPVGALLSTSARTYAVHGWFATTWRHWNLTLRQALPAWRRLRQRA